MARGLRGVKAAGRKVKHGDNLFPRHAEPLHDFFDTCAGFEVLENGGNRHTGVLKYPRATALARDTLHGWTLGPIESCHILTSLDLNILAISIGAQAEFREWVIEFGHGAYVALYHYEGKQIVILAVRHGREAGY
ncbi:MAG: hypothetical protein WAN65_30205 [Candidatus Sulfotelmatobacter sp.]